MVNPTDENAKMQAAVDREEKAAQKQATALNSNSKNIFKNTLETAKSTATMIGMTQIVGGLGAMLAKSTAQNEQLSKNLVQATNAQTAASDVMKGFRGSMVGVQQALDTFGDAVMLGMSRFGDGALKFSAQLKAQGIDNKGVMMLMRRNVQALGHGEEATLRLADSLVSTAVANGDSIDGLISAINSMKEALTKTTVELGPEAAANAQEIAAMMAQGNTELQAAASKFVTSFLAGSDGFMKAARLGVTFTGQETTAQMAAKFEEILTQIGGIQAGRRGTGSQFFFDAMERSFKLTREDFLLQQQIGNSINALVEGNTQDRQERLSDIAVTQAWQNALFEIQSSMLSIMTGVANALNDLGGLLSGWFVPLVAGSAFLGPTFLALKSMGLGFIKFFSFLLSSFKLAKLGGVLGTATSVLTSTTPQGAAGGAVAAVLAAGSFRRLLGKAMASPVAKGIVTALGVTPMGRAAKVLSAIAGAGAAFFATKKLDDVFEDKSREDMRDAAQDQLAEAGKFAKAFEGILSDMSDDMEASTKLQQEQVELARRRTRIVEAQFTGDRGAGPLMEISRFLVQNLAAQQQIIELTEAGNADRISARSGTATSNGINF